MGKRLPHSQVLAIREHAAEGYEVWEIAQRFTLHRNTIFSHSQRSHIPTRHDLRTHTTTPAPTAQMGARPLTSRTATRDQALGWTGAELAALAGLSPAAVRAARYATPHPPLDYQAGIRACRAPYSDALVIPA